MDKLAFLDFEASSLSRDSYPIEAGWVTEDGTGESHLIRPAPEWVDWDAAAAVVHGISREELQRTGEPHGVVCDRLIALFADRTVFVGAPSWDGHWLSMLLRAAGKPRHLLRCRDSEEAFAAMARIRLGADASPVALADLVAGARAKAEAEWPAHRALPDAWREWSIWQAIKAGRS